MMHWDPNQLPEVTDLVVGFKADFHGEVTSSRYSFAFDSHGEGLGAVKRTLGCLMLTNLPEAGLNEALDSLKDIWTYHIQYPALPAIGSLLQTRFTTGTVTRRVDRPPLYLPGEE